MFLGILNLMENSKEFDCNKMNRYDCIYFVLHNFYHLQLFYHVKTLKN